MKKILFILLAIVAISSFCSSQLPSVRAEEIKTFTGKIESIKRYIKSSPPKWEHAMLTVVADSGEKTIVYVIKATVVTDASGKDMSEGGKGFGAFSLKKGERIEVKYSTVKKDHNEAISIRCVPFDYVQQPTVPTTPTKASPQPIANNDGTKTFIGKVESATLTFGTPPKWSWCKIVVVPDNGDKSTIFIPRATTMTDVNGKDISGRAPDEGKRVEVKYLTAENGRNEAISIRCLD